MLDQLEEIEDRASKRGKTIQWIRRRQENGYFINIVRELAAEDTPAYHQMMRMKFEDLTAILREIVADITPRQVPKGRHKVISAAARLTMTLRFRATGETFRSLSFKFRISRAAISYIVKEVCQAIEKRLGPKFLALSSSQKEWQAIALNFEDRWNFPNCLGGIDGEHIIMEPPAGSGSFYHNYKNTNSIVLMPIAGTDFKCLYADIGTNARVSDGGVWNKCSLSQAIESGTISLPPPKCLPHGVQTLPHNFVAEDAFALKTNLMKPYPQKVLDAVKKSVQLSS